MIKWIKVRNPYEEELTINLTQSEPTHGLLLSDVSGLGPKATLSFSEYALLDGAINTNSRVEKRTIGITFRLTFAPDIETARQQVYRYFPIKGKVRLWFATDHRTTYIDGIVESIDPSIFSENEEVVVSVVCEDPFFKGSTPVTNLNLDDPTRQVIKKFEFPFQNESDSPEIEFGEQITQNVDNTYKYYVVNYEGDMTVGLNIVLYWEYLSFIKPSTTDSTILVIDNLSTGEKFKAAFRRFWVVRQYNDGAAYLTISSIKGKKFLASTRDGSEPTSYDYNNNAIKDDSDWLTLRHSENILRVYFTNANGIPITFESQYALPSVTISYENVYQGV